MQFWNWHIKKAALHKIIAVAPLAVSPFCFRFAATTVRMARKQPLAIFTMKPLFYIILGMLFACPPTMGFAQSEAAPGKRFPSIFGIPSAFPAPGGTGFVGLVLVHPRRGAGDLETVIDKLDGDLALGYTLGNPVRGLSATFGATVTSLKDFGDDGALQVSLSRALAVRDNSLTFAGVSATNLAAWGLAKDNPPAYSIYLSHLFALPLQTGELPVQITVGYGDQVAPDGSAQAYDRVPFAGLGFGLSDSVSLSIAATQNEIYAGVGFGISALPDWTFSFGAYDITQAQGRRQFALSIARGF